VVQPRLSALEGVQRADILGARTFAMRVWLKPDRMAALNISPVQVRQALAANNYLAAVGRTKGALIQVNLTANTDLRSVEEFKNLVVREKDGTSCAGRCRRCGAGRRRLRHRGALLRADRRVHGHLGPLPNANSIDVIKRVREEMALIQKDLPTGSAGPRRL
jgi:multidrug efflux pump